MELTRGSSSAQQIPVVLFGQGGIGKTQIALEYVRRHETDYSAIVWLDGTSPKSLHRTFEQFAMQLKNHYDENNLNGTAFYSRLDNACQTITEPKEPTLNQRTRSVGVILEWLNHPNNKEWLLIYDNVDEIDEIDDPNSFDIRDFFPEAYRGRIIITSRRRETCLLGTSLEVDVLNDEDGLELLHSTGNSRQVLDEAGTYKSVQLECSTDSSKIGISLWSS